MTDLKIQLTPDRIDEIREGRRRQSFDSEMMMVEDANRVQESLRNLEFGIATFLFTFTSPIFTGSLHLTQCEKQLFFWSWIFLAASGLIGMIGIIVDVRFFLNQGKLHAKTQWIYSNEVRTIDGLNALKIEENKLIKPGVQPESSSMPLIFQTVTVLIAFALIMRVAYLILFNIL